MINELYHTIVIAEVENIDLKLGKFMEILRETELA